MKNDEEVIQTFTYNNEVKRLNYYTDGNMWCCVIDGEFTNLQESPAGFGETKQWAFKELLNYLNLCKN